MRIIHAHKFFYLRGGAERYMLSLMRMQERAGHQVAPFSMHYSKNDPSPWSDYFVSELKTESGIASPIKLIRRAFWSREAKKKMVKMIKDFRPDVIHVHNIYTHISPSILAACREAGVPVVMTAHDYALLSANYSLWDRGKPMNLDHLGLFATARTRFIKGSYLATLALDLINRWHRFRRHYVRGIDRFLANSKFTADRLADAGIPADRTEVTYPFLDATILDEPASGASGSDVLYFGRLVDYKGVDVLIDAMRSLPDAKLRIVGTGPQEGDLRLLAKDMKNVSFDGFLSGSKLWDAVRRARVVVVPSVWYEAFGLTALEAMALGRPVIASNLGGLAEIVEDEVSGRIVKAGDVGALARAIKSFTDDPSYANSLGEAARHRALELGDPEEHLERIMEIYREVIG